MHTAAAPHVNRRQTKRVRGSPRYKPQLPSNDMHSVASNKNKQESMMIPLSSMKNKLQIAVALRLKIKFDCSVRLTIFLGFVLAVPLHCRSVCYCCFLSGASAPTTETGFFINLPTDGRGMALRGRALCSLAHADRGHHRRVTSRESLSSTYLYLGE